MYEKEKVDFILEIVKKEAGKDERMITRFFVAFIIILILGFVGFTVEEWVSSKQLQFEQKQKLKEEIKNELYIELKSELLKEQKDSLNPINKESKEE